MLLHSLSQSLVNFSTADMQNTWNKKKKGNKNCYLTRVVFFELTMEANRLSNVPLTTTQVTSPETLSYTRNYNDQLTTTATVVN